MKQHRTDVVALIFGLAFAMVGAGFIINEVSGRDLNPGVAVAGGFLFLGVVALMTTLLRGRPAPAPAPEEAVE